MDGMKSAVLFPGINRHAADKLLANTVIENYRVELL
jgi:Phosphoribosylformylglycinamidine (FGAM) synthase